MLKIWGLLWGLSKGKISANWIVSRGDILHWRVLSEMRFWFWSDLMEIQLAIHSWDLGGPGLEISLAHCFIPPKIYCSLGTTEHLCSQGTMVQQLHLRTPVFFFPEVAQAKKCYCHVNGKGKFVTQKFLGCIFRHSILFYFIFG